MSRLRAVAALALAALVIASLAVTPASARKPPHVRHVFTIVLENENYETIFGKASEAPYLARKLRHRGELLSNYYGIGHFSLGNYIAMISGQAPNLSTQLDCLNYTDFMPATPTADGQYVGNGCVYPNGVETIANQLEDAGLSWREYAEDMNAKAPPGMETPCRHPAVGSPDDTQRAEVGDQYATRHNPFVYFHSIIDFPTCAANVVDFSHLRHDLKHERTTPNYSFITPNLCNDGHDSPCVDGEPGGLVSANDFLKRTVPRILRSPAYKHHGLLIVTFDEAETSDACCNEQSGPNTTSPGLFGPGGGRTGTVLLSPCIKPGTVDNRSFNHYSMLRSIEDNFQLPRLGYAGQQGLLSFDSNVLNRRSCAEHDHHH